MPRIYTRNHGLGAGLGFCPPWCSTRQTTWRKRQVATPIDLSRVLSTHRPFQRVHYELQEIGQPTLKDVLEKLE